MKKAPRRITWANPRDLWATLAFAAVFAAAASAMEASPPWDVSTEERLAAWQELAKTQAPPDSRTVGNGPVLLEVSGQEHPELFLRWQLFDHLIGNALVASPEQSAVFREAIQTRAVALGFGADLWHRLEQAAAPFVENRKNEIAIARQLASTGGSGTQSSAQSALTELSEQSCGLRWSALVAAQREFGVKTLDSLLYRAVAPDLKIVADTRDLDLAQLQWVEEGCK